MSRIVIVILIYHRHKLVLLVTYNINLYCKKEYWRTFVENKDTRFVDVYPFTQDEYVM
jgi:hypothetical protein